MPATRGAPLGMPSSARQAPLALVKKNVRHDIKRLPDITPPRVKVLLRIKRVEAGKKGKRDLSNIGRTPKKIMDREIQSKMKKTAYVRHLHGNRPQPR